MKHRLFKVALALGVMISPLIQTSAAEQLKTFHNCVLQTMRGSDGDSFLVKFPDGQSRVIRLYSVDCIEANIWDENDSRRLREQRRYFGISHCRNSAVASIKEAKHYGKLAHREVKTLLAKPFSVHTSFADGRGSGYHQRIYAFITTSDDKDLGSWLVANGLARAFGVCRKNADGVDRDEQRASLDDLEFVAAKQGLGVWKETNWDLFTLERKAHRTEVAELSLAIDRAISTGIVDPNTAPRDQLMTLPGIGETLAVRIIENRPYRSATDLLKLKAFGEGTLARIQSRLPEKFHLKTAAMTLGMNQK